MTQSDNELLRAMAQRIMQQDEEVAERARAMQPRAAAAPPGAEALEGLPAGAPPPPVALETIVVREGRPVLLVSNDDYVVDGPEAAIWRQRLETNAVRSTLQRIIPAVGRIEVENHPTLTWVGTGWLIDDNVIVTNRHVAEAFARQGAAGFVFRRGWTFDPAPMSARVDFREERDTTQPNEFRVLDILHIEDDDGPDIAFLRVADQSAAGLQLAGKIQLATDRPEREQFVATIGYPAADSRVPDQDLVRHIFGDVYNVKRLAPGQLLNPHDDLILHDCSTLGGNSGSPIVDLESGMAVGLHFSGLFLRENRGVSARVVNDRLEKLRRGTLHPVPGVETQTAVTTISGGVSGAASGSTTSSVTSGGEQTIRMDVTIPIEVTVKVGDARVGDTRAISGPSVEGTAARTRAMFDIASLRTDGFSWASALSLGWASQLAYQAESTVRRTVLNSWQCEACHVFSNDDTEGFIAAQSDVVFVAFRGTSSVPDWLRNLDLLTVEQSYGRVHRGFFTGYDVVQAEIRQVLDEMDASSKKLWFTGHSLGGALSAVAAAELMDDYGVNGIYTYGMPRTGKRDFQDFFARHYSGKFFRFVNNQDIVPRLPPTFHHVGQLFFFDGQGRYVSEVAESLAEAAGFEPGSLTEAEFERLQAELNGQTEALEGQSATDESLEGFFPSVSDHAIGLYISLIQRQLENG